MYIGSTLPMDGTFMSEEAIEITSMASLERVLLTLGKSFGGEAIWWRGHADANWRLKPGAFRDGPNDGKDIEEALIRNFRTRAIGRLGHRPIPSSEFEWLLLAQHYGLPTRLLDWTENLLTALYFAVSEKRFQAKSIGADGCIWAISPTVLNEHESNPDFPDNAIKGLIDAEEPTVQAMSMKAFGFSVGAIVRRFPQLDPVVPNRLNFPRVLALASVEMDERIVAQAGRFTIHEPGCGMEELKRNRAYLHKFLVPADYKSELRTLLKLMGIRNWNLFPDLQSLAEGLKEHDFM
jgi:hypothetical protein